MDGRQQRGMEIAAQCRIDAKGENGWLVPSQSGEGRYTVTITGLGKKCSCPDHETRGVDRKHIFAVQYLIERMRNGDGSTTVTATLRMTETVRRTYPQKWTAYNAAQTTEKDRFQVLLADLCRGIAEPQGPRVGHPRLPLADAILSAAFKVYSTVSGWRFMSDLREPHGLIGRVPTLQQHL